MARYPSEQHSPGYVDPDPITLVFEILAGVSSLVQTIDISAKHVSAWRDASGRSSLRTVRRAMIHLLIDSRNLMGAVDELEWIMDGAGTNMSLELPFEVGRDTLLLNEFAYDRFFDLQKSVAQRLKSIIIQGDRVIRSVSVASSETPRGAGVPELLGRLRMFHKRPPDSYGTALRHLRSLLEALVNELQRLIERLPEE